MRGKYPNKDSYDPAPYEALGTDHRKGIDVTRRVIDLIMTTRTRPGFMAKRLNTAGIPAPHGGAWTWIDVRDTKDRERWEAMKRGDDPGGVVRTGAMRVGPCGSWGRSWG